MAKSDLGKDLLLIHARMFNHRAAMSGEIKHFVKEFESRRGNREVKRLQEVVSSASKIDHCLPECVELSSRLAVLQDEISKATDTAVAILNRESDEEDIKYNNKEKIEAEWNVFTKEIEVAKQDVEKRHRERIQELKRENQQRKGEQNDPEKPQTMSSN
eukprot:gene2299-17918_t